MSPAKRLSRQRFRALCERCRAYVTGKAMPRHVERRAYRFIMGSPQWVSVAPLGRLAR